MIKEMKQQGYSNPYIADYLNSKRYSGVHRKLIERISLGKSKMYSPQYYN